MNPQPTYFRQNKNFKKSWEKGDPNDELDGKKQVYFSFNLPNINLRYHKIFYMYQMNPHKANFGRNYKFSRNIVS